MYFPFRFPKDRRYLLVLIVGENWGSWIKRPSYPNSLFEMTHLFTARAEDKSLSLNWPTHVIEWLIWSPQSSWWKLSIDVKSIICFEKDWLSFYNFKGFLFIDIFKIHKKTILVKHSKTKIHSHRCHLTLDFLIKPLHWHRILSFTPSLKGWRAFSRSENIEINEIFHNYYLS